LLHTCYHPKVLVSAILSMYYDTLEFPVAPRVIYASSNECTHPSRYDCEFVSFYECTLQLAADSPLQALLPVNMNMFLIHECQESWTSIGSTYVGECCASDRVCCIWHKAAIPCWRVSAIWSGVPKSTNSVLWIVVKASDGQECMQLSQYVFDSMAKVIRTIKLPAYVVGLGEFLHSMMDGI
jgi:hypothetical protein